MTNLTERYNVFAPVFDLTESYRSNKQAAVNGFERAYVAQLVKRFEGNVSKAARAARMDRKHLADLMKKHRMTRTSIGC